MTKQDNTAAKAANMMQAGAKLEYLRPLMGPQLLEDFSKWIKDHALADARTMVDSIMKLAMKTDDDHFEVLPESRGAEAKHPSVDDAVKGEPTFGELHIGVFHPSGERVNKLTLAVGVMPVLENEWKEVIIGLHIDTEEETTVMPSNPAPVAEKFRPTSFRSTSDNGQKGTTLKQLSSKQALMGEADFANWFLNNASSKEGLDRIEALKRIILDSPVLKNRNPALDQRFFVTVPLHASQMPAVTGNMDPNISGYCDITVVEKVREDAQERRQVALYSFTTLPVLPADGGLLQLREMIASYIEPAKRGVAAVEFDMDQVYTFHQFSELFKQFDPDGAGRLDGYQLEVRGILRRLYDKEAGSTLFLKAIRKDLPYQHNNGAVVPGNIGVYVFDSYQQMDEGKPLLTFRLVTGLASDAFVNRHVEIIQACECDAADELNRQLSDAKEEARIRTLENVGLASQPIGMKRAVSVATAVPVAMNVKPKTELTATTFKTASFAFFKGTITGLFPLMQETEADRVSGFVDYLANEYALEGEHHEVLEVTYLDHDHIAIVVTEKGKVAFCLELDLV